MQSSKFYLLCMDFYAVLFFKESLVLHEKEINYDERFD